MPLFATSYRVVFDITKDVRHDVVTHFRPMPVTGHGVESFVVGGKRFQYSDFAMRAGFDETRSHGGPVREGLHVRIHYFGDDIAKLEVEDTSGI
jgi:hypothetical protein